MTNFPMLPTSPAKTITATALRSSGVPDTGFSAPITWSVDQPSLLALTSKASNAAVPNNQVIVVPILPAANAGGVATVTAQSMNENGLPFSSSFTVTITVNPDPANGFTFA